MKIHHGLPEEFRAQAAEIYWQAFASKLQKPLGPKDKAQAYFERVFEPESIIIAYQDQTLLGIAGFDSGNGGIIRDQISDLFAIYHLSAIWRLILLSFFSRPREKNTLQIDGIAVFSSMRGQGVGTALLQALYQKAQTEKCDAILLEVVNTNPRALKLYEREGFEVIKVKPIGVLSHIYQFTSFTQMIKRL